MSKCLLSNKPTASNKLKHSLTFGPQTTRPPGSTEHKRDPETRPQPDERNHQQRKTNSAALPNAGYKYHRIFSILHRSKERASKINNLCKQEKVVRSHNAGAQS